MVNALAIKIIGTHREVAIYERPDGQGGWIRTCPLPADAEGKELYTRKGFRLLASPIMGDLTCSVCGFKAKSLLGLGAHMRKHK